MILTIFLLAQWTTYTHSGNITDFLDKDSLLFIGTKGGILVLDKKKDSIIAKITNSEGLPENYITSLSSHPGNGLWVGFKNSGLGYLYNNDFSLYDLTIIQGWETYDVYFNKDTLFVATDQGLRMLLTLQTPDISDDQLLKGQPPMWSYGDTIYNIYLFRDSLFIASKDKIYRSSISGFLLGFPPDTTPIVPSNIEIQKLVSFAGTLFILSDRGIFFYPSGDSSSPYTIVRDIVFQDSLFYIATQWGLYRGIPGNFQRVSVKGPLSAVAIRNSGGVYAGHSGGGFRGKGIYIYDGNTDTLEIPSYIRELSTLTVRAIVPFKGGFATGHAGPGSGYGITVVDSSGFSKYLHKENSPRGLDIFPYNIDTLNIDTTVIILLSAGYPNGLFGLYPSSPIISPFGDTIYSFGDTLFSFYTSNEIQAVQSTPEKFILFSNFRTSSIGLLKLPDTILIKKPGAPVFDVEWDNGIIWAIVHTHAKIIKIDLKGTFFRPEDDDIRLYSSAETGIPGEPEVRDIEIGENEIYLASASGLLVLQKNPVQFLRNLSVETGYLQDNNCYGVEIDSKANIWVLNNGGLAKIPYNYDPEKVKFYFPGSYSIVEPENSSSVVGPEILKIDERNNKVYIGTDKGVSVFEPPSETFSPITLDSVILYPNPVRKSVNKYFYIRLVEPLDIIKVFTLSGKEHHFKTIEEPGRIKISSKDFTPGIYILYLKKGTQEKFVKFSVF